MPSTPGTGSKTAIPNEQRMAGSLCYSIVTRSDASLTRSVSFFLNAIFLRVHCVESNDITFAYLREAWKLKSSYEAPKFGPAIQDQVMANYAARRKSRERLILLDLWYKSFKGG
jgi:hypothetical protein